MSPYISAEEKLLTGQNFTGESCLHIKERKKVGQRKDRKRIEEK